MLGELPGEILLVINDHLTSVEDKAHAVSVSLRLHSIFQPVIEKLEKQAAKEAAEYAIYPTKENVEKLKELLKDCPALLLHPVIVKNRHGKVINGTVYQVALHECDDELINDVIKPAFKKLHNGLETMEVQRKIWLPEGWLEAEERACASALAAIDNLFAAFENASNPNDVTESPQHPFTITINHQGAKAALDAYQKAIDSLYTPTNEVITGGRDPGTRLLERIMDRYEKYNALGGFNTPRNNALLRKGFGYAQQFAPVNFMQTFAQGPYYIVENKEKLTRSFEYRNWRGHFILSVDSDPLFRLGHEYFADAAASVREGRGTALWGWGGFYKTFCQSKTAAALQSCIMQSWKSDCAIM